jgi:hypothetical protein
LAALDVYEFLPIAEAELAATQSGWEEIREQVQREVAALRLERNETANTVEVTP